MHPISIADKDYSTEDYEDEEWSAWWYRPKFSPVRGRQGNRYCSNILKKIQKNECCRLAITGERNNNSNSARTHKSLYAYKKFNWITVDLEFVSPISINKYVIVIAGQSGLMGGAVFFYYHFGNKIVELTCWIIMKFTWFIHIRLSRSFKFLNFSTCHCGHGK